MPKAPPTRRARAVELLSARLSISTGGATLKELTELATQPVGPSGPSAVSTQTEPANARMAVRKLSALAMGGLLSTR
jgi:hypothetical protein